jgi:hypothetical protein
MRSCESMSYATRAGIGFVICVSLLSSLFRPQADAYAVIVLFALFAALSVRRRRRVQQAFQAQQRLSSAGVAVHPTAGGAWSQHLAGGPAAPPQAHYAGVYAPGYMAPVRPSLVPRVGGVEG